jgi:hypothetical protein
MTDPIRTALAELLAAGFALQAWQGPGDGDISLLSAKYRSAEQQARAALAAPPAAPAEPMLSDKPVSDAKVNAFIDAMDERQRINELLAAIRAHWVKANGEDSLSVSALDQIAEVIADGSYVKQPAEPAELSDAQIKAIHWEWFTSTGGADTLYGFARAIERAVSGKT